MIAESLLTKSRQWRSTPSAQRRFSSATTNTGLRVWRMMYSLTGPSEGPEKMSTRARGSTSSMRSIRRTKRSRSQHLRCMFLNVLLLVWIPISASASERPRSARHASACRRSSAGSRASRGVSAVGDGDAPAPADRLDEGDVLLDVVAGSRLVHRDVVQEGEVPPALVIVAMRRAPAPPHERVQHVVLEPVRRKAEDGEVEALAPE